MNWEEGDTAKAYRFVLDNIGVKLTHTNIGFTKELFETNKSLFCFDFSANLNNGSQLNQPKHGLINLYLEFERPLETTVQTVVMYNYHAGFLIDKDNSVVQISI